MDESGSNQNQAKDRASSSRSRHEDAWRQRPQILVVEDSKTDVFLIREALKAARIEADVTVVHDGHEATEFFDAADANEKAPCPDVVLLDMNLPRKNGEDVLKHMRGSIRCRNAAVLIVTSSGALRDYETVAGLGISGYWRKPSGYDEFMKLGGVVQSILDKA